MSIAVPPSARDMPAGPSAWSDWQRVIFAPQPERAALLRLEATWALRPRRIRFHRNHSIEAALRTLKPFLEYAGIAPELIVSDYDDSLSFSVAGDADVEVIWLDFARFTSRMTPCGAADWLGDRLTALRDRTLAPILVLDWDGPREDAAPFSDCLRERLGDLAGVHVAERTELFDALGDRYFDPDRSRITGTRVSSVGATLTARLLGLRWFPALLDPPVKAVVVDLDQTLYAGVLGEDGSRGVQLSEGHRLLQQELRGLRDAGVFLGLLSRNEPADVRALFEDRPDFPLRWEDFSAHSISWGYKSNGLATIAHELRIDTGAVVFVDDNPGELLEVSLHAPGVRCLHAGEDASHTAAALRYFPGLWKFEACSEDRLRVADLRANEERLSLARTSETLDSYYRELKMSVTLRRDDLAMLPRAAELSAKTNQFNLAMRRYSEAQLRSMLTSGRHELVTARLEDRLTDSGVIAMAVLEQDGRRLLVDELCISCRALGRHLEDVIVGQMLSAGPLFDGCDEVVFNVVSGPRNQPARDWLARFAGKAVSGPEPLQLTVPASRTLEASVNPNIKIGAF